jgi:diaminopimelate decarboxylase
MKINNNNHLEVGGIDTIDLAKNFGTPLWVIDEAGFRQNCRSFRDAFNRLGDSLVLYASKALTNLAICRIVEQEGLGLDVVSGGELYTTLQAGFPLGKVYFHGNNKSQDELKMACRAGVGRIVVDNFYELELLNTICAREEKNQDIMLRITPGVEAHTHEYIQTGQLDSKFGFTIGDQAMAGIKTAVKNRHLKLVGLHCHIGSQIFEMESFRHAVSVMIDFMHQVRNMTGHEFDELDVGGGFGIYYYHGDTPCTPHQWAEAVMHTVQEKCRERKLKIPRIVIEPGRAISSPAGITLYTVGSINEVPGVRKYLAIDGGMTDNPRPALYNAQYTAAIANKMDQAPGETVSIAGKCCESGDMLIWDAKLPRAEPGDILVVFTTGAYNYSMSSNYNRVTRPAMVLANQGIAETIVKRETYDDLIRNDLVPDRLK